MTLPLDQIFVLTKQHLLAHVPIPTQPLASAILSTIPILIACPLLFDKQQLAKPNEYYHEIHPTEASEVDAALAAARAKAAPKPPPPPPPAPPTTEAAAQ